MSALFALGVGGLGVSGSFSLDSSWVGVFFRMFGEGEASKGWLTILYHDGRSTAIHSRSWDS